MNNYSEIRLTDLEHVIHSYISSWETVVVAGLAFQNKKVWHPSAFFAWTDPASAGRRGECQIIGHPTLPRNVILIKEWCFPPRSWYILDEILKGGTVEFSKTPLTFADFKFGRSAFLSSTGFDHLYCQEIQPMTMGRPKLFVEGALGDNIEWERLYKEADIELAFTKYLYHSLHNATGSLIGVKTGVSINRGLLQFVLAIPIETRATSESQRMKYNISMHPSLQRVHTEIRYTGRTEGNEREVKAKLSHVKKTGGSLQLTGSLTIPADTVATSLSLLLDGMRVETVPIEQLHQIKRSQESGESMDKAPQVSGSQSPVGIPKVKEGNERKVFVVHGRDEDLRSSIFNFLRCIGLQPMEWGEILQLVGTPNPSIMEILDVAFSEAQAVLVLLSPDDLAYLRPELQNTSDPLSEKEPTGQARPNVLFELGLALARSIDRTVVVQVGDIRPISDIAGRHILRLTNNAGDRTGLTDRLKIAGCPIDLTGKRDYFTAGDFTPKHARTVA